MEQNLNEMINVSKNEYNQTKENNDKFVYKEGELKFAKTQCGLCKYNNASSEDKCEVYPNGKPQEVMSNIKKCNYLDTNTLL